ncbi:hypothetical protein H7F33_11980 [Pedobacter sp. PAMC26386]|nr:hypothetical protein H7F33_11980 [Pedobacter sp. PAMC26386]
MKNSIAILAIFTIAGATSALNAQTKTSVQTPLAVTAAFAKEHPNVKPVWEKEKGAFEAGFIENKQKKSALYTPAGVKTESEVEISASSLPDPVKQYVKTHYKGNTIKEGAKITKSNGEVNYEAAIKGKDLIFDHTGKFIKEAKD